MLHNLAMGLGLDKHIVSWKYSTGKIHLIYLTYQTWHLSLAYFRRAPNIRIRLQLEKNHLTAAAQYYKRV